MYEVTKEIKWDMAHRLVKGYKGKCNSLHGHSWVARVTVGVDDERFQKQMLGATTVAQEMYDPLDKYDMLIDFGDFKPLRKYIDTYWDHATMLYTEDPLVVTLQAMEEQRLVVLEFNPTSEVIAYILHDAAKQYILEGNDHHLVVKEYVTKLVIARVEVEETCTSKATYYGRR